MLMHPGDKLHIITRRLFPEELRRHFIGEVQSVNENAVRVKGYVFVQDRVRNEFQRRDDVRIRVFSLVDAGLIINIIPAEVDIEEIRYEMTPENHVVVTDGKEFSLDMQEFS
ncbi:hypothetical protein JW948_16685 [bacterium]|nr:hypothetical protein [bacterium]